MSGKESLGGDRHLVAVNPAGRLPVRLNDNVHLPAALVRTAFELDIGRTATYDTDKGLSHRVAQYGEDPSWIDNTPIAAAKRVEEDLWQISSGEFTGTFTGEELRTKWMEAVEENSDPQSNID